MISLRKLKPILRSRPLKCAIFVFFVMLVASIIFREPEKSGLKPRHKTHDYEFNAVDSDYRLLVVLIMTGPRNLDRRNVIRETWLSDGARENIKQDICHHFVIGTKNLPSSVAEDLLIEQNAHNDLLLLEDFEDAYNKLTEKLGQMLEWLDSNLNYKYVLKADDDTYVRLDQIVYALQQDAEKKNANNLYWGYFYGRAHVKQSGPWKETTWKLCDYYLPYARGGGYVLSRGLVEFIANNWGRFQLYLSEDVTLGVWLAPLKLTRVHDPRFDTEYKSRGCKNDFIVSHKQSIVDMKEKYNNIKSSGKLCNKEVTLMHGYVYNWDTPPSQCCIRSDKVP